MVKCQRNLLPSPVAIISFIALPFTNSAARYICLRDFTHIPRQYIINENNQRVAVQLDIKTFEKIEEIIENYGLATQMKEAESDESLSLEQAKAFYIAPSS